jgi:hypothetical protein
MIRVRDARRLSNLSGNRTRLKMSGTKLVIFLAGRVRLLIDVIGDGIVEGSWFSYGEWCVRCLVGRASVGRKHEVLDQLRILK